MADLYPVASDLSYLVLQKRRGLGELEQSIAKELWAMQLATLREVDSEAIEKIRLRFDAKVDKSGDCWIFEGSKAHFGHGRFRMLANLSCIQANRVAWLLSRGPIPDGQVVRHTCDVAACVNPDHLILGTQLDNVRDRVERGRNAKGEANGTAKLTEASVREIRASAEKTRVLAARYRVNRNTIHAVRSGRAWTHVEVSL